MALTHSTRCAHGSLPTCPVRDAMVAAAQGYTAMIRPLLQAGAIVEAKDAQGQTAVARARQKNHAFIVQLLEEVAAQQ